MVTGWPVNFIVDADPGLVGLQGVREAADLQNQEVHGIQDFLAVHHPVSQTLQLSMAHWAWQGTGDEGASWKIQNLCISTTICNKFNKNKSDLGHGHAQSFLFLLNILVQGKIVQKTTFWKTDSNISPYFQQHGANKTGCKKGSQCKNDMLWFTSMGKTAELTVVQNWSFFWQKINLMFEQVMWMSIQMQCMSIHCF